MVAVHKTVHKPTEDCNYSGSQTYWNFSPAQPINGVWHGRIVKSNVIKEINPNDEEYPTSFEGKNDSNWTIVVI